VTDGQRAERDLHRDEGQQQRGAADERAMAAVVVEDVAARGDRQRRHDEHPSDAKWMPIFGPSAAESDAKASGSPESRGPHRYAASWRDQDLEVDRRGRHDCHPAQERVVRNRARRRIAAAPPGEVATAIVIVRQKTICARLACAIEIGSGR
jgi:hypothetical protein